MDEITKYQWTGVFTKTINGVTLSENHTIRVNTQAERDTERDYVIKTFLGSAKSFPEDEGNMAHAATEAPAPICGVHKTGMTWKPAGVSKAGKAYPGFWSCGQRNPDNSFCNYRPSKE